jgi:hypothetical protein
MTLTKDQRRFQRDAVAAARRAALHAYFTGPGSRHRIVNFLHRGLSATAEWFARCLLFASWALVAGLLIGPEHDAIFSQVHAWAMSMSVDQLRMALQSGAMRVAVELLQLSLFVGFLEQLVRIAKPSAAPATSGLAAA